MSKNKSSRNLVLAAALGYGIDQISLFMKSLRKFDKDSDIVLLVDKEPDAAFAHFLSIHRAQAIIFRALNYIPTAPNNSRYLAFHDILCLPFFSRRQSVLLTDIRDVYFQGAPFEGLPEGEFIIFALEDIRRPLESEPYNKKWILDIFGEDIFRKLSRVPISCSGTTLGSVKAVEHYLTLQAMIFHKIYTSKPQLLKTIFDQGVHNYLVHLEKHRFQNASLVPPGVLFATIGIIPAPRLTFDQSGLSAIDGEPTNAAIIHQYDRHPELVKVVKAKFG